MVDISHHVNKHVGVIIVNFNSTTFLNKLIQSLSHISQVINEIIIVDNNSQDINKLKTDKNITLIKKTKNVGFAKAVNQGIKKSKSKFILLVNPDCLIIDDSIIGLIKKISSDNNIGVIGGKIQNYHNSEYQPTANTKPTFLTALFEFTNLKKIFPNNTYTKRFWVNDKQITNDTEVDSLCGAFLIFRKIINKRLNLFDENYFLYLEDVDFGLKNKKEGYKVVYSPDATIKHLGGASNNSKYNTALKYWYKSRKYFYTKHSNKIVAIILLLLFSTEENLLKIYHFLKNEPIY